MAHYLDTSAAVKLVVEEPETAALRAWLSRSEPALVSSDLLRTELLRATRRAAPDQLSQARLVLESVTLLALPAEVFDRAGQLTPSAMRSLDALHLAAALEIGSELESLVTYDERLGAAATDHGVAVTAPT